MKILHVNCNYLDSMLHQTMINTLSKYGVENEVFVPIYSVEGHVLKTLEKYVKATVCFNKVDRFAFHIKQSKIYRTIKSLITSLRLTAFMHTPYSQMEM